MLLNPILRRFETWIDPFRSRANLQPPRSTLGFIWFYISQARMPFIAMLVLGGTSAAIEAALFWFVGRLVDILGSITPGAGWNGLLAAHGGELFGMLALIGLVRFVVAFLIALVDQQVITPGFYNLARWQSYLYVSRQSLSFFQSDFSAHRHQGLVGGASDRRSRHLADGKRLVRRHLCRNDARARPRLDFSLAAVVLFWLGAFSLLARHFVPRIRHHSRETAEAGSMLNGRMVDSYSNMQTLKLFARDEESDRYMRQGFDIFQDTVLRFTRFITGVRASMALLSGLMIVTMAGLSVDLWLRGLVSSGAVAFSLALVLRLNFLLGRLMTQFNGIMRNLGTIQNAAELISQPLGLVDRLDAKNLVVRQPGIRFDNVSFRYGKGHQPVIENFSLTVRPGEKVGIVGRSGAGKSTLMNLLLRLYDIQDGRILIDGQDIAAVTQESLRMQIGVVSQDTSLLHRSVRDNILFGRPDAGEDGLVEAARRAEAIDFIARLQDQQGRRGFDAHVGERGVKLSGGQRQRIAIARVMLKDAPILVLDEATSALDSEVEEAIQSNLHRIMEGKTVLAIAHRLSTIAALDRLIVVDLGRIIEEGSHDELLRHGGLYAELWARQSGGFLATDEDTGSRIDDKFRHEAKMI